MSALAQILHDSGEKVQGSDVEKKHFLQKRHYVQSKFQSTHFLRKIYKKA